MLAGATVKTVKLAAAMNAKWAAPLAEATTPRHWPDGVDSAAIGLYLAVAFGLPLAGYWLMAIDIRHYLRSLRRALVVVARAATPSTPYWTMQGRPPCLQALELDLPCTEAEVLAAYRQRVKALHPDRGGDLRHFLRLQKHFEQALHLARSQAKVRTVSVN